VASFAQVCGVVLIPLVLFRKNLFEPMGLLVSDPLIHERGLVSDDELLAASITPQGTHFMEIRRLLSDLTLFYCHCLHLLNFSDCMAFRSFAFLHSLRVHFTLNSMALPNFFLSFLARPNATMT